MTALPAEGYHGLVPDFPLPAPSGREIELWEWAWRTPQACAWSLPSEAWRAQTVARWVRQAVKCESESAAAADHGQLHRYADQIGLTTAGLREMGWKVAVDEVAAKRAGAGADEPRSEPARSSRERMKVIGGSGR